MVPVVVAEVDFAVVFAPETLAVFVVPAVLVATPLVGPARFALGFGLAPGALLAAGSLLAAGFFAAGTGTGACAAARWARAIERISSAIQARRCSIYGTPSNFFPTTAPDELDGEF